MRFRIGNAWSGLRIMTFEQSLFPFLISIGAAVLVTYGITRWRNAKDATSVFAQDSSLEDVALSALSSLFSKAPTDLGNGRTELSPTWGFRRSAPMGAWTITCAGGISSACSCMR